MDLNAFQTTQDMPCKRVPPYEHQMPMLWFNDQRIEFGTCSAALTTHHPTELRTDSRNDGLPLALGAQVDPGLSLIHI